jgi:hypothetical protein
MRHTKTISDPAKAAAAVALRRGEGPVVGYDDGCHCDQ